MDTGEISPPGSSRKRKRDWSLPWGDDEAEVPVSDENHAGDGDGAGEEGQEAKRARVTPPPAAGGEASGTGAAAAAAAAEDTGAETEVTGGGMDDEATTGPGDEAMAGTGQPGPPETGGAQAETKEAPPPATADTSAAHGDGEGDAAASAPESAQAPAAAKRSKDAAAPKKGRTKAQREAAYAKLAAEREEQMLRGRSALPDTRFFQLLECTKRLKADAMEAYTGNRLALDSLRKRLTRARTLTKESQKETIAAVDDSTASAAREKKRA